MCDEEKAPGSAPAWERVLDKFLKFAGPILLAYIAILGTSNRVQMENIEAKQGEAAQTTQVVKETLETKTVVDQQKAALEAAQHKDDAQATRINLYGTWRYLDGVAVSPEEKKKADEAKRVYEDFVRKHPPK